MNKKYKLTMYSCFVGIFVQALVCNITAILFVPFMTLYNFNYTQLGSLVGIIFFAQLFVDIAFSRAIDRIGYKKIVVPTSIIAFVGLLLFAATPLIFDNIYIGVIIATLIFSSASGLLEIVLSPIVDAIPHDDKGGQMALMHSFYAWGQVATIIITTVLLAVFGIENWQYILLGWSLVPAVATVLFLKSKYPDNIPQHNLTKKTVLIKSKFFIVCLLAIFFGGASEVTMNQWASSFMEKALIMPKLSGDLIGMCGFAIMLGIGRTIYGIHGAKIKINKALIFCAGSTVLAYLVVAFSPVKEITILFFVLAGFFTSLLWPGTLVVSSAKFPMAGGWMFAILAAAGDIGAGTGPWFVGIVTDTVHKFNVGATDEFAMRTAILAAVIFPLGAMLTHIYLKKHKNTKE